MRGTEQRTAIAAEGLAFAFGDHAVVDGVSLAVPEGEMLGVVGPNGSGKTTLLRLLSGLLRPRAGAVRVLGRPATAYTRRELARLVAVVPPGGDAVFPYTVEEMVAMGRLPHLAWPGWLSERDRGVCREAMRRTDTERFAGRTIDELSSGERQRVLIARALAQEARIVLLDEASSFLDLAQELGIFRMLDGLRREEGLTFVTVSHDLNLVGAFCQQVLLLREGRVLAAGPLRETYTGEKLSALFGVAVETAAGPGARVRVQW
ncbi:MAG TPA: ABC transporter ATP-binding protein [Candidatus Methanoperedens sp.]|nr:ABC transporter ATP-binding protein [Candidatus Methanoperedens sp.]